MAYMAARDLFSAKLGVWFSGFGIIGQDSLIHTTCMLYKLAEVLSDEHNKKKQQKNIELTRVKKKEETMRVERVSDKAGTPVAHTKKEKNVRCILLPPYLSFESNSKPFPLPGRYMHGKDFIGPVGGGCVASPSAWGRKTHHFPQFPVQAATSCLATYDVISFLLR